MPRLTGESLPDGALLLADVTSFPGLPRVPHSVAPELVPGMASFIPRAIQSALGSGYEDWVAELRPVTVLFVHLPELDGTAWDQAAVQAPQEQLYRHEGSLNKLGSDPRGVMALLVFGLPRPGRVHRAGCDPGQGQARSSDRLHPFVKKTTT